jgi:hypothetical protein
MTNGSDNPDRTANSAKIVFSPETDWEFRDLVQNTLETSDFIDTNGLGGETAEQSMIIVEEDESDA